MAYWSFIGRWKKKAFGDFKDGDMEDFDLEVPNERRPKDSQVFPFQKL